MGIDDPQTNPPPVPKDIPDKGTKTSEFWISLMTALAGLGLIVYGAVTGKDNALGMGTLLMGLPSAAYPISRGLAKK